MNNFIEEIEKGVADCNSFLCLNSNSENNRIQRNYQKYLDNQTILKYTDVYKRQVADLLEKQSGRRADLPYGVVAKREYDSIVLWKDHQESAENDRQEIVISEERLRSCLKKGEPIVIPAGTQGEKFMLHIFRFDGNMGEIPRKMYTKWFDYDKIRDGFSIRTRRKQDYFVFDGEGHRQKLADYFCLLYTSRCV